MTSRNVVVSGARPHDPDRAMKAPPHLSLEPATQLALFLSNRPGALAKVCAELAQAEINIHALAISDTVDHSIVRMVVSDPMKALMILGEGGMIALEAEVLMIESDNAPGTLARITEDLAKTAVNIEYAHLATRIRADKGLMILRPSVRRRPCGCCGSCDSSEGRASARPILRGRVQLKMGTCRSTSLRMAR